MNPGQTALFVVVLVAMGAGWGITQPLGKIAVSTGYQPFGLIFWQLVIAAIALAVLNRLRGRRLPVNRTSLPVFVIIAVIGTVIPNGASYQALIHLPAGVHSVLMSLVPMAAFPIALALGLERFSPRRLLGLLTGLGGVLLLVLPDASLPESTQLIWVSMSLISVICYGFEGNYVARWGTGGLDAVEVLFGAAIAGALIVAPMALATGQFISPLRPFGAPEWALVAASLIHVAVYTAYVWLVGRAGAVFAGQVGYLVTGFGVFWAMLILGEGYSPYFWAAMVLVLGGVSLVQPRRRDAVAPAGAIGQSGA